MSMKRNRIRLTEPQLHNIIKESVKSVLCEMDIMSMPINADANGRNAWWKLQVDSDFPNHGIKSSKDWQTEYNSLSIKHKNDIKAAEKQRKVASKLEKSQAKSQAKLQKQLAFQQAFSYVMGGSEDNDEYNKFFVDKWPVVVLSRETRTKQVMDVTVDGVTKDGYIGSLPTGEDVHFVGSVSTDNMRVVSDFKITIDGGKYKALSGESSILINRRLTNATRNAMNNMV